MARTSKKQKPALRDREIPEDDPGSDEFDDELTEPVLSASDIAHTRDDDRRDSPVTVSGRSLTRSAAGDEPLEPDSVPRDRSEDEFTAPVMTEPDAEDRDDDDTREEPDAVPWHFVADMPKEDQPLEPGFVVRDRFEIVDLVHTGVMSRVYRAIDRRRHAVGTEHSYVAIKLLRPSALPQHDAHSMLEREAAAAQRLAHPNVVNIFDFDIYEEHFYLVMEWLEGESLKELLQRTSGQQLAPEFAWQIIHGVANALAHAHSNNIVHADINLSNIFITDTKQIKLLDFGVSRPGGSDNAAAGDELIWVTRKYASPEVLSGSVPVFADDIFALGCVAYRLLSGEHPFGGTPSLEAKRSGMSVPPIPGLAAHDWQTLQQVLQFNRADRPATPSVFLNQQPATTEETTRHGRDKTPRVVDDMRRLRDRMHRAGDSMRVRDRIDRVGDSIRRVPYRIRGIRAVPRTVWLAAIPVVAIAVAAGLWSLLRTGSIEETGLQQAAVADRAPSGASRAAADLDERLRMAAQAMADERYVLPKGYNARQLYGEVLAIDPGNPAAAAGLREISDIYVQQASTALSAGQLTETADALMIAADADPDNPGVARVWDLLLQGAGEPLVDADPSPAEGDLPQVSALVSEASPASAVEAQEVDQPGQPGTASSEEQQLIEGIAKVESYMAARRLTLPADDSAYGLVIALREQHGSDERLRATIDRLADRLLTEAAIAAAARDNAEAERLLGAAENLGADSAKIESTRRVLAINAEDASVKEPTVMAAPSTAPDREAQSLPTEDSITAPDSAEDTQAGLLPVAAASPGGDSTGFESARQEPAADAEKFSDTPTAVVAAPISAADRQAASIPVDTEAETASAPAEDLMAASAAEEDPQAGTPPVMVDNVDADPAGIERPRQLPAAATEALSDTQSTVAALLQDQQTAPTVAAAATALVPVENADAPGATSNSGAPAEDVRGQPKYVSLEDMSIERYVAPVYPRSARRRGLTGNVEINFRIFADGSTGSIEVLSSQPGDVFVSSATKAVSKWRFEPPGEVVTAQVNIRFDEE